MQMIDAETVHRLLPYKMLIKELKEMHKKKSLILKWKKL